ncbi:MAG: hypothetical protein KAX44_06840, partial [Candidatus Brocadiae bacterium]|nr:hypothetical protein [Candidatus Brocadiia bacterium]
MRAARPFLIVACLAGALVSTANAADLSVNPCPEATVRCRADDRFLDVTYRLNLHNPTGRRADVRLLSSVDVLESVEGLKGDLVLSKAGSAVRASVPAGWRGLLILRAKQRISRRPAEGTFSARVAIPPALSRIVELDLPGGNVELQVRPRCIVRRTDTDGDRTTFRLLPLQADVLTIEWRQVAPGRRPAYSLHEVHRITERAPGYRDEVTLEFLFPDTAPPMVSARIPAGVSVVAIEASHRAVWTLRQETLEVLVPEGFSSGALSVTCQLEGATSATEDGAAQLLEVPLFASPEAERHTGRVLLTGDLHELNFVALQSATQTAAEDGAWRLACDFRGPGARVLVKIVPIEIPAHASVETFYAVSAFKVDGEHRLSVMRDSAVVPPLEALLPAGHVVRSLSSPVPVNWSQEGWVLHVQTESAIRGPISVEFATEWLIGGKAQVQLGVPVVTTVASSRCAVGIRPAPNIQIKTAGEAETWRVPPGSLPEWMKDRQPSIGYTYTDAPVPVELEILPIEAEIRGQVQEHVTVWEERIQRDSLFLLEISKRPVEELTVLLPAGLNVERVGGPAIEGWELSEDQDELTVRFGGPVQGACHFYLASEQPAAPGRLVLHGIHLEAAPHLKGWLGIGSDVAVAVRPLEDGRLGIGSVRTEQAPAYLKGFDNKLLYEFYDSRWELELATEIVPPVYSAKVLNVFRFRAAQVAVSALFNVTVHEGGVSELDFELPANATGPQFQAPDVVLSQLGPPPPAGEPARGRTLHVRLRGKHTGTFACRLDYGIVSGMGRESIEIAPVRLHGAREQTGLVVLTQARPDAGVKVAPPPRELTPTEAEERYPDWSFTREHPALAAFSYRGDGWKLPVVLTAHPLSEVMLQASIPLAKLDTLVQKGPECINHLRLYVSNTSKQFLTVDLAGAGPEARLIGTYVYGEPVKPFREGKTKLQLPLFTSEKATSTGMAVLDIIYATPHRGLG